MSNGDSVADLRIALPRIYIVSTTSPASKCAQENFQLSLSLLIWFFAPEMAITGSELSLVPSAQYFVDCILLYGRTYRWCRGNTYM